jgi:hypothetical protein
LERIHSGFRSERKNLGDFPLALRNSPMRNAKLNSAKFAELFRRKDKSLENVVLGTYHVRLSFIDC